MDITNPAAPITAKTSSPAKSRGEQHARTAYDEAGTRRWIQWNLDNYQKYGFGLWALVLKETGAFIGDCGITMQSIDAPIPKSILFMVKFSSLPTPPG